MSAGELNVTIEPGTSYLLPITYLAQSTPVDLTGCALTAIFQRAPNQDPSLVLSTSNGGILATPALGKFSLYATYWQTEELASVSLSNKGVWKLQVATNQTTPFKYTLLSGKVIFQY